MTTDTEKLAQRTRRNLQEFRMAFTDLRFDTVLSALPEEDQLRAARARHAAALAVLRIDNEGFKAIAAKLEAEESNIEEGIEKLDDALDDLAEAKMILDAATSAITLVGRALSLTGIAIPI
jgi:hypothetical protein